MAKKAGYKFNKKQIFVFVHIVHGVLILIMLLSGLFLYVPELRTFLSSFRAEFVNLHSAAGIVYMIFLLFALPTIIQYGRLHRRWQKTFHLCLQLLFGLGWVSSGIYLWISPNTYLSIRQAALFIHDILSAAIVPWVFAHIGLWYARKYKKTKRISRLISTDSAERDRGMLISRRDVLLMFFGSVVAFIAGGLYQWYQPLSEEIMKALQSVKKRGYFRIYSIRMENPIFDRESWFLKIDGLVDNPSSFSFDELMNWEAVTFTSDFHCVTGWSVREVKWKGILFRDFIDYVMPTSEGRYVKMYSADQLYSETYELSQLLESNVILAYELEGKPLIEDQGAPLRLFHPNMFGYKSIKWLNRIEFVKDRGLGYWEEKESYDINGYLN
jgi:methionine sulfoxide reductase catalytic subunit